MFMLLILTLTAFIVLINFHGVHAFVHALVPMVMRKLLNNIYEDSLFSYENVSFPMRRFRFPTCPMSIR